MQCDLYNVDILRNDYNQVIRLIVQGSGGEEILAIKLGEVSKRHGLGRQYRTKNNNSWKLLSPMTPIVGVLISKTDQEITKILNEELSGDLNHFENHFFKFRNTTE